MDVRVSDDFLGRLLEEEAALVTENERLRARIIEAETRPELSRRIKELEAENERLRAERDKFKMLWEDRKRLVDEENELLRGALRRIYAWPMNSDSGNLYEIARQALEGHPPNDEAAS